MYQLEQIRFIPGQIVPLSVTKKSMLVGVGDDINGAFAWVMVDRGSLPQTIHLHCYSAWSWVDGSWLIKPVGTVNHYGVAYCVFVRV